MFRVLRWLPATILVVPLLVAARQERQQPERGEQILNAACVGACHDPRPIETHAFDESGWTKEVKSMIEKGAEVKTEDVTPLVDYLVRYHGPLPDGPGRELVLNICTQCHNLERVRRTQRTPEGWLEILETMLNEGAPLSEKDLPTVLLYLAKNFRPER